MNGAVARTTRSNEIPPTWTMTNKHHAEGRGEQADHQVQDHHQAEVHGIDTDLRDDLHQDGAEDQDRHDCLEEAADDQQDHVDDEQQDQGLRLMPSRASTIAAGAPVRISSHP